MLKMRQIPYRAGARAWIRSRSPDETRLLPHNEAVRIVSESRGYVFVKGSDGRDFRFSVANVDPGVELQGRSGHWYFEDHPKALTALSGYLEKLTSSAGGDEYEQRARLQKIEEIKDILARHEKPAKL